MAPSVSRLRTKPSSWIDMLALRSPSPSSSLLTEVMDLTPRRRPSTVAPVVVCDERRTGASSIPKLEPFSRSRIERCIKDPPLLTKTENDLSDYCSTLEGDESCSCWRSYFELKKLQKELPKEDVEKFVRQAGGVKSLISYLHGITAMPKRKDNESQNHIAESKVMESERPFHVPDGLPKTQKELDEEEKDRMPDSPFTRLLRSKGRLPEWYTQAPDHETD